VSVTATDTRELTEISHHLLTAIRGRDAKTLDHLLHAELLRSPKPASAPSGTRSLRPS
jgi:hypothetical protein